MKSLIFFSLLASACSIEEMNVEGPKDKDAEETAPAEVADESATDETDTAAQDSGDEDTAAPARDLGDDEDSAVIGKPDDESKDDFNLRIAKTWKLVGANPANKEFVGGNYCPGNSLGECYLRSGYIYEFKDGTLQVSLEFMNTYDEDRPYKIFSADLTGAEEALLLTDEALSADDESMEFKKLWAVVVKADKTMAVVYDRNNDGPTVQGDDMLDALEFVEVVK